MTSRFFTEEQLDAHQRRVKGLTDSMAESCATIERVVRQVVDTEQLTPQEFVDVGMGTARMNLSGAVARQATFLELRSVTFALQMPPTVNEAWFHIPTTGGKALTDEHRAFRTNVISRVRAVMRTSPPLAGRIELTLRLYFANRRRTDIDNRVKPLQDALTHAKAYHDDSQIDRLIVERILGGRGDEECVVILREIAA
jgi:Holliday junction resolvase RusA-like endonuclease